MEIFKAAANQTLDANMSTSAQRQIDSRPIEHSDVKVNADKNGKAKVTMTLSTKSCPLHEMILGWVETAVLGVEGVKECEIDLVWEPEWNIQMASDFVKAQLGVN